MIALLLLLTSCGGVQSQNLLVLRANGEAFVRQGFVSKDGWQIEFFEVRIALSEAVAYQTDVPFDASDGGLLSGESASFLRIPVIVDLAAGDESAEPIVVSSIPASPGQYNAIEWTMENGGEPTIVMIGIAEKDGETVRFEIESESEYRYTCGEYVGDERIGFLEEGGTAEVEMTFHFDHIFGDGTLDPDDPLNRAAVGFQPFAELAIDGQLWTGLEVLELRMDEENFLLFEQSLATLGHVGEGHCFESTFGYTDRE